MKQQNHIDLQESYHFNSKPQIRQNIQQQLEKKSTLPLESSLKMNSVDNDNTHDFISFDQQDNPQNSQIQESNSKQNLSKSSFKINKKSRIQDILQIPVIHRTNAQAIQIYERLAKFPLVKQFIEGGENERTAQSIQLCKNMTLKCFKKHQIIMHQEESSNNKLYIPIKGKISIIKESDFYQAYKQEERVFIPIHKTPTQSPNKKHRRSQKRIDSKSSEKKKRMSIVELNRIQMEASIQMGINQNSSIQSNENIMSKNFNYSRSADKYEKFSQQSIESESGKKFLEISNQQQQLQNQINNNYKSPYGSISKLGSSSSVQFQQNSKMHQSDKNNNNNCNTKSNFQVSFQPSIASIQEELSHSGEENINNGVNSNLKTEKSQIGSQILMVDQEINQSQNQTMQNEQNQFELQQIQKQKKYLQEKLLKQQKYTFKFIDEDAEAAKMQVDFLMSAEGQETFQSYRKQQFIHEIKFSINRERQLFGINLSLINPILREKFIIKAFGEQVNYIEPGSILGEKALTAENQEKAQRSATCMCLEDTDCVIMEREDFLMVQTEFDKVQLQKVNILSELLTPINQIINKNYKNTLFQYFKFDSVIKGTKITIEGDEGDKLYILNQGKVMIEKITEIQDIVDKQDNQNSIKEQKQIQISILDQPCFFGEEILQYFYQIIKYPVKKKQTSLKDQSIEQQPMIFTHEDDTKKCLYYYTVTALQNSSIFYIKKQDLQYRFPPDTIPFLQAQFKNKEYLRSSIYQKSKENLQNQQLTNQKSTSQQFFHLNNQEIYNQIKKPVILQQKKNKINSWNFSQNQQLSEKYLDKQLINQPEIVKKQQKEEFIIDYSRKAANAHNENNQKKQILKDNQEKFRLFLKKKQFVTEREKQLYNDIKKSQKLYIQAKYNPDILRNIPFKDIIINDQGVDYEIPNNIKPAYGPQPTQYSHLRSEKFKESDISDQYLQQTKIVKLPEQFEFKEYETEQKKIQTQIPKIFDFGKDQQQDTQYFCKMILKGNFTQKLPNYLRQNIQNSDINKNPGQNFIQYQTQKRITSQDLLETNVDANLKNYLQNSTQYTSFMKKSYSVNQQPNFNNSREATTTTNRYKKARFSYASSQQSGSQTTSHFQSMQIQQNSNPQLNLNKYNIDIEIKQGLSSKSYNNQYQNNSIRKQNSFSGFGQLNLNKNQKQSFGTSTPTNFQLKLNINPNFNQDYSEKNNQFQQKNENLQTIQSLNQTKMQQSNQSQQQLQQQQQDQIKEQILHKNEDEQQKKQEIQNEQNILQKLNLNKIQSENQENQLQNQQNQQNIQQQKIINYETERFLKVDTLHTQNSEYDNQVDINKQFQLNNQLFQENFQSIQTNNIVSPNYISPNQQKTTINSVVKSPSSSNYFQYYKQQEQGYKSINQGPYPDFSQQFNPPTNQSMLEKPKFRIKLDENYRKSLASREKLNSQSQKLRNVHQKRLSLNNNKNSIKKQYYNPNNFENLFYQSEQNQNPQNKMKISKYSCQTTREQAFRSTGNLSQEPFFTNKQDRCITPSKMSIPQNVRKKMVIKQKSHIIQQKQKGSQLRDVQQNSEFVVQNFQENLNREHQQNVMNNNK